MSYQRSLGVGTHKGINRIILQKDYEFFLICFHSFTIKIMLL
jgi:hypothetical protein